MEDAARRLIGVMDERAKKRLAGGRKGPAEIADPQQSPAERVADSENMGLGMLDRCPPVEYGGRTTVSSETCANGRVRPGTPDFTVGSEDHAARGHILEDR